MQHLLHGTPKEIWVVPGYGKAAFTHMLLRSLLALGGETVTACTSQRELTGPRRSRTQLVWLDATLMCLICSGLLSTGEQPCRNVSSRRTKFASRLCK